MNVIEQAIGSCYAAYHGDCVDVLAGLPERSVDYSIFSPPFASLYTYSNSPRDMGNCRNDAEFFEHFAHLIRELRRVMKPGRNVSFHCMLMPTSKERDGYIGLKDFRGDLIRAFQAEGFIYASDEPACQCGCATFNPFNSALESARRAFQNLSRWNKAA